jgi:uncharacterized protein (DUF1778 family)
MSSTGLRFLTHGSRPAGLYRYAIDAPIGGFAASDPPCLARNARRDCASPLVTYNVRVMEPTASPKTRRIEVRLSDEERKLDAAAASALGESLSDFFRRAAQERAQEVLADQHAISLGKQEAERFLDALERPDEGTVERLKELRARA